VVVEGFEGLPFLVRKLPLGLLLARPPATIDGLPFIPVGGLPFSVRLLCDFWAEAVVISAVFSPSFLVLFAPFMFAPTLPLNVSEAISTQSLTFFITVCICSFLVICIRAGFTR